MTVYVLSKLEMNRLAHSGQKSFEVNFSLRHTGAHEAQPLLVVLL
jgi:hypothetical protein